MNTSPRSQTIAILSVALTLCLTTGCTTTIGKHHNATDTTLSIERSADTSLRIVCYNGFFSSIFPTDKGAARSNDWITKKKVSSSGRVNGFASWASRADADIFALQEILYTRTCLADTTAEGIKTYFNGVTGKQWHVAGDNQGRLVLSRHPILWSDKVKNARGMAALIDLPEKVSEDLLLINLHFLSGDKAAQRKQQAQHTVRFIKQVREGSFPDIPKNVPILICGDFNSPVDAPPHAILTTLDEDPKKAGLKKKHYINPKPLQLNSDSPGTYGSVVWEGEVGASAFQAPARTIDHVLVPKGYMTIDSAFILNSLILPEADLRAIGIQREDLLLSRDGREEHIDHLPIFVDLK